MIHLWEGAAQHVENQVRLDCAEHVVERGEGSKGIDKCADLPLGALPKPPIAAGARPPAQKIRQPRTFPGKLRGVPTGLFRVLAVAFHPGTFPLMGRGFAIRIFSPSSRCGC